jgi:lipoprotein-releasing system permease protein
VVFFIMIVAAFGIMSTLIVFVVQKTREIGLLKAVGATSMQIMWLFLSRSLALGVVGVAGGFAFGLAAISYRNEFLHFMRRATGFELFPASIYGFSELPAMIVPGDVAVICGGSLIICLLAGVVPAWIAGRLRPVEALRYE